MREKKRAQETGGTCLDGRKSGLAVHRMSPFRYRDRLFIGCFLEEKNTEAVRSGSVRFGHNSYVETRFGRRGKGSGPTCQGRSPDRKKPKGVGAKRSLPPPENGGGESVVAIKESVRKKEGGFPKEDEKYVSDGASGKRSRLPYRNDIRGKCHPRILANGD